jgi:D-sedoheptulose 7-phosphate isomerase
MDVQTSTTAFVPSTLAPDTEHFQRYSSELVTVLDKMPWALVAQVGEEIVSVWRDKRSVYVFGNGGSSATAQHMAADLSKNTTKPGSRRLRAMCLSDNTALFTALANDHGYDRAIADQIAIYANAGDLAIAISASGNSPNVLAGVARAQAMGMRTIGVTGYQGGRLAECVSSTIVVPCHDIEQIEDFHMVLVHMLTSYVRGSISRELGIRPW